MNKILELLDRLEFEIPYSPSQGENGYRVIKRGFEMDVLVELVAHFTTLETKVATYKLLPSKYNETELVLYKFNK